MVNFIDDNLDKSIRNNSKLIGEQIYKLKPSKETNEQFKNFYENSDFHNGACFVI